MSIVINGACVRPRVDHHTKWLRKNDNQVHRFRAPYIKKSIFFVGVRERQIHKFLQIDKISESVMQKRNSFALLLYTTTLHFVSIKMVCVVMWCYTLRIWSHSMLCIQRHNILIFLNIISYPLFTIFLMFFFISFPLCFIFVERQ